MDQEAIMSKITFLLAAAATLTCVPAAAAGDGQDKASKSESLQAPPARVVSYSGLDLASKEGRKALNKRISAAVTSLCGPDLFGHSHPLWMVISQQKCVDAAKASAEPQVIAAVELARSRQLASGGTGAAQADRGADATMTVMASR